MSGPDLPLILLMLVGGAVALGVAIALLIVAVRVTGGLISAAIWLVRHLMRFVGGVLCDTVRFVGALVAAIVALPFATANVILGRWPRAERWGRALRRECKIAGYRIWSLAVRRPLQLLCLDGALEGVEERLPEADRTAAAPSAPPVPPARRGSLPEFEGYRIEGGLRPGGSGAKLYVAVPEPQKRAKLAGQPERVVIKSFALEEGSSLPQIVRESRALDAARAMGLVLDHGLDAERFWYAIPYHSGMTLAEATRMLHARSGPEGLTGADLAEAIAYVRELVGTLVRYHEGGLWHKDVKPDNIVVHDGRAHLVDLGLVTPLGSAMTLTTHGTEYFRDPEMVRQALRGVRVHQVDGAKFDVYGAGAVLYFVLENTFPAHGGLSTFARPSPEALRWIARRAMADYHHRYPTADAMLRDLDAVVRASDPWAVRPVDLPSMRGADAEEPVAMGAVHGGRRGGRAASAVPPTRPAPGRPRLIVTDWWRGSYASPDVAERIMAKAGRVAIDAKRPRPKTEKKEPPTFVSVLGIVIATVASILVLGTSFRLGRSGSATPAPVQTVTAIERALPAPTLQPPTSSARLLVVSTHAAPADPEVSVAVARVVEAYEARGFEVVRDDPETAAKIAFELLKAKTGATTDVAAVELDAALAAGGYFGALHIDAIPGGGRPIERMTVRLIGSEASALEAAARAASEPVRRQSSRRVIRFKNAGALVYRN
jgi:serine/threonine protein kinase